VSGVQGSRCKLLILAGLASGPALLHDETPFLVAPASHHEARCANGRASKVVVGRVSGQEYNPPCPDQRRAPIPDEVMVWGEGEEHEEEEETEEASL